MFLELIATFVIGIGTGGAVMLLSRLTRGRVPRWLIPAGAAGAMIAVTIWSEYTWFARTFAAMPPQFEVTWANSEAKPISPWTYLIPLTSRFTAMDTGTIRTNPALPDQRLVDIYLMGRWMPVRQVRAIVDCTGNRRADLVGDVALSATGRVEDRAWTPVPADDPLKLAACRTGGR